MSGLNVLEEILSSLDEARSFGVRNFKEVIFSSGASRVRNVFYTGNVLGVQEFDYDVESLIREEIAESNSVHRLTDKTIYLYEVRGRLQGIDSGGRNVAFKNTTYSNDKSGIFAIHPSFDSVCRDYDNRFVQELKPSVKYSIVTPAVKAKFPVCGGWRDSGMGIPRSTNGTMIIYVPFSITPNPELQDISKFFNPEQTPQDYTAFAENAFEQAGRVIKTIRNSSAFEEFTKGCVKLSSEIDKKVQEEHLAGIR